MLIDDNVNFNVLRILVYCYSNQECSVKWLSAVSNIFRVGNGTRQGSMLSPYLFSRYIRGLISAIVSTGIGCSMHNKLINILAYADDIVLLASSWRALQFYLRF